MCRATWRRAGFIFRCEALAAHGLTEADIVEKRFDARYAALMKSLIARTRELFRAGQPLAQTVERFLRVDLEMFSARRDWRFWMRLRRPGTTRSSIGRR